jgi:DHA1 family multidrug resistance protein-like MFS transporter
LLLLSFVTWFSLSLFEGTFALHGKQIMQFGPARMGMVFMVCGAVMATVQGTISGWILDRKKEPLLIVATGFTLVAAALSILMLTRSMVTILLSVGVLAFGVALLIPTLAVLVSKHSEQQQGTALGVQIAANSLGQFAGPALGGLLFAFSIHAPYLATALLLFGVSVSIVIKFFMDGPSVKGLK